MNRLNFSGYILLLLGLLYGMAAQGTRLEGFEPDYAGRTIEFFTSSDPVSKNEKAAFSLRIGPQGRIQVETNITETLFCYADFDSYRGKMVVSPGQTLKIKLPPLKLKTFEESKNPYFKPIEIWIINQSNAQSDLNNLFARFDQRFYTLNEKYFNQLYLRQQRNYLDSVRLPLEKEFAGISSPELKFHQKLQMKTIEAGIIRAGREKLMADLKDLPENAWKLPVFAELVDRLFTNTLSLESKTTQGARIRAMIAQRNLAEIKKWTESYTGTTSPLSELLLIKMLHDAFYSGEFPKNAIIQTLQGTAFTGHANIYIRGAAASVSEKIQFLYTGTYAPKICLPDLTGDTICSSASNKSYQYILFADLEIPVCREHLKYLTEISQRIGDRVEILVVLTPSGRMNNQDFIKSNNIPGRIVTDNEAKTIGRLYKVRSWPSAFLLNREHKVVLAPAKTPLDGFELQLAGVRD
jgi:hypothetical protein